MGLEGVEILMGFEEAFGLRIPDEAASAMWSPRHSVDLIASRLPMTLAAGCLTQRAFYRIRRGLRGALGSDLALRPATRLRDLGRGRDWPRLWALIREAAGEPAWPDRIPRRGWLAVGPESLRELALYIAMHQPGPAEGEPWTREQVELTVRRVIWEVVHAQGFDLDARYARDLLID